MERSLWCGKRPGRSSNASAISVVPCSLPAPNLVFRSTAALFALPSIRLRLKRKVLSVDKSSFAGLALGLGGIIAGLLLEGGKLSQVLQPTAAIIVFGGTLGAVLLQYPMPVVASAFRRLIQVFFEPRLDPQLTVQQLLVFANKARRQGMISLDADLPGITDPFLRKSLMLAVDGTEPQELRKMMQLEIDNQAEYEENIPKVFESAGGFAPTI